ncbi:uncharacterized protein LOC132754699 [Ruditapes philippinarum]|uniref:uncharacterized protein LOC132754699 n=1 Tax=Ruditapes philippinarum TaxID=129788 RepID=UPI00295B9141|nr:uncharacterized protein LOC132754699 [Ruditapes philippinarum]
MDVGTLNCSFVSEDKVVCNGTTYKLPDSKLDIHDKSFWIYLAIYVALVLAAGLMSGLTMGLLSLDMMTLKVLKDGGTPSEKKHAQRIIPIVKRHHLLLVTLLLGNAAAVEAMPIFLDRISDPVTAILVSVTAVLIFGEVIPQAICTRFGLAIGSSLAPLVYLLMGLFFVIAWPLSKLLDCMLGKDHDTFYRRAQLKVLVDLHGDPGEHLAHPESLSKDEVMIIKGALDMKSKTAKDAMVPIDCVYMLDINRNLDNETMSEILEQSHSRIPVYDGSRDNIVGLLLVKTLIKLDPDDATPIRSLVENGNARQVLHTSMDKPLFDLLNEFQEGRGHLAVVHQYRGHEVSSERQSSVLDDDPHTPLLQNNRLEDDDTLLDIRPQTVGIITLEDVLEELIQEEIIDETDVFVDIKRQIQVARAKAARGDTVPKQRTTKFRRSASHPPVSRQAQGVAPVPDLVTINKSTDDQFGLLVDTDTDNLLQHEVLT